MFASLLFGAAAVAASPTTVARDSLSAVTISQNAPEDAGAAILRPFVSFSIEFASFPDFAGMYVMTLFRRLKAELPLTRQPVVAKQVLESAIR